jgi:hypothetical protein
MASGPGSGLTPKKPPAADPTAASADRLPGQRGFGPPPKPLTADQGALMRAWIDQRAKKPSHFHQWPPGGRLRGGRSGAGFTRSEGGAKSIRGSESEPNRNQSIRRSTARLRTNSSMTIEGRRIRSPSHPWTPQPEELQVETRLVFPFAKRPAGLDGRHGLAKRPMHCGRPSTSPAPARFRPC